MVSSAVKKRSENRRGKSKKTLKCWTAASFNCRLFPSGHTDAASSVSGWMTARQPEYWNGNVAEWGGGGQGLTIPFLCRGEKMHIIHFNNLMYRHVDSMNYLTRCRSQSDHRSSACSRGKHGPSSESVLTWLWFPMSCSGSSLLSAGVQTSWIQCVCGELGIKYLCRVAQQPDFAVAQQDRLYGTGWSSASRNKSGWHPPPEWDPHRVWWAVGVTCSAVTSSPKKKNQLKWGLY